MTSDHNSIERQILVTQILIKGGAPRPLNASHHHHHKHTSTPNHAPATQPLPPSFSLQIMIFKLAVAALSTLCLARTALAAPMYGDHNSYGYDYGLPEYDSYGHKGYGGYGCVLVASFGDWDCLRRGNRGMVDDIQ
ncbi:hypothetical protein BDK51DRAFT_48784 [Blyttiomyces helicus]|uniref:Uncharacterized protein n=1 Tax=Blyttiomyces helicus TaxID=388810 RepID=A0A4P9VZX1_9FUNG|nr:hypothetical protein BDK51DRAFT_48784 [Blyttiomyces helicus]|eukprot:RKO85344.1 hypothetical protein BDK51DRAFT_48784 [Blyttiomyces helicus]